MSCNGCNLTLEDTDLMTELPCCGLVMHSKCALKLIADGSYDGITVYCPGCQETIWTHPLYMPGNETLPEACLNELKGMKSAISTFKKGFSTFRKKVNDEKRGFREQIKPHLDAIRLLKKERKDVIKASPEFKAYTKIHRVFMKQMKEISEKYGVPLRALSHECKLSYWRSNAIRYINISFYIRA